MGLIITGGEFKGRRLATDTSSKIIRPTSGKVREALFSSLGEALWDATFVDLYAGSGSVGLEAASRGACEVHFVENHPKSWTLLKANLKTVSGGQQKASFLRPIHSDVLQFCRQMRAEGQRYDFVFADPPFEDDYTPLYEAVLSILVPTGVGMIQFPTRHPPVWLESSMEGQDSKLKRYGESSLVFLKPEEA